MKVETVTKKTNIFFRNNKQKEPKCSFFIYHHFFNKGFPPFSKYRSSSKKLKVNSANLPEGPLLLKNLITNEAPTLKTPLQTTTNQTSNP